MKNKWIGFYNYTVILTYIGFAFGFSGILFAMDGVVKNAMLCLMLAGVCDMFDGPIARTMDRTDDEKRFGIQIDSLCDLVCFGILPAVLGYKMSNRKIVDFVISVGFALCGLIRLAFFNVDEEKRQQETDEVRKYYKGLPITSSAMFIPFILAISLLLNLNLSIVIIILLALMGICFISPIQIKKPHKNGKIAIVIFGLVELVLVLLVLGGITI